MRPASETVINTRHGSNILKIERNGARRHKSNLQDQTNGAAISPQLVIQRCNDARSEALKHFFAARDSEDFYFEDVLNSFIALAQYPLNFAIFVQDAPDGHPEFWTHFCTDKAQESAFLDSLREDDGSWTMLPDTAMFRLFTDLLESPRYFLAVFHFDARTNKFELVNPQESKFPETRAQEKDWPYDAEAMCIATPEAYLASCADNFFQFKWDAFDTDFQPRAAAYLMASLDKLDKGQKSWGQRQTDLQDQLQETVFPHPGPRVWVDTLNATFSDVLRDSADGIDLVTSMMRDHNHPTGRDKQHPPNLFLAYRTFTREHDHARNRVGDDGIGYLYDTSFLIPDALHESFRTVLGKVRDDHRAARNAVRNGTASDLTESYEAGGKRRLYRNIRVKPKGGVDLSQTLRVMDEDFWDLLSDKGGLDKCIQILASKVGSKNRSLVDPVYHTGLTYTNHLYRQGGLERLGNIVGEQIRDFDNDVPKSCQNDVRRVVIFYYVMCEILGWVSDGETFDPDRVAAVLVPIKMRGAVWGVTIHAVYTPNYDAVFADQRYWQGYFKLTTDHRSKNRQVLDRNLWGLADEMLTFEVIKLTKAVLRKPHGDYDGEIDMINLALRSIERKSPFAFPEFRFEIKPKDFAPDPRHDGNLVRFTPNSRSNLWLCWDIVDNQFFTARQPWSGRATRNFRHIVEHGILAALSELAKGRIRLV